MGFVGVGCSKCSWCMCICVCVCTHMCARMCAHLCVHSGARGWRQISFSISSPPYCLRQGLSWNLELAYLTNWLAEGPSCLISSALWQHQVPLCLASYGGLASILLTGLSLPAAALTFAMATGCPGSSLLNHTEDSEWGRITADGISP